MSEQASPQGVPVFELRHRMALALEQAGVTNEQMADEIGRGVTTVRNYLKGRTEPTRSVLVTWSMRCGVPLEWLMRGVVDSGPNTPDGQVIDASGWFTPTAQHDFLHAVGQ